MDFIERNALSELREVLQSSRAGAILGARQVGKSTLAKQLISTGEMTTYVTLDEDAIRTSAIEDPDGFIVGLKRPAVIDEIQRAPDLLLAIKRLLDQDPEPRGQFLITGSSNLLTNRHVADALPGRIQYVNLWPFSQGEMEGHRDVFVERLFSGAVPGISGASIGRNAYAGRIVSGGYPEISGDTSTKRRARFFESYLDGVLIRDLKDVLSARTEEDSFATLLKLLAARTGGEINYRRLGDRLGLTHMTAKAHVSVLVQLFLAYALPAWSTNLGTRQIRSHKIYLADSGMACALGGIDEARFNEAEGAPIAGALIETFVLMEIVKQRSWAESRFDLFFYRDKEQREVDIVAEATSGEITAIEVKSTASIRPADTRGLKFLRDKLGDKFVVGVVLYTGAETLPLGDRLFAVPLCGLWGRPEAKR